MRKILFPTDFSPASTNAFSYALNLAKRLNAEILTLHVGDLAAGIYNYPAMAESAVSNVWGNFEQYRNEVAALREMAVSCEAADLVSSHILRLGETAKTIAQVAAQENADYIVMGTKGTETLMGAFMGTVTEKVMNAVQTTVIAVPENCKYADISKILFPHPI